MNIAFITNEGFPSGMATTNRILSLVKGLELQGRVKIKVYCVRPTENIDNKLNTNWKGNINDNILFLYTNKSIIWPKNKIAKLISLIKGSLYFIFFFIRDHKKNKYDIVISTISNYWPNFLYFLFTSFFHFKFLLTVDEYPNVIRNSKKYPRWYVTLYLNTLYKYFDGLIVMTTVLMKYYKKYIKDKCKMVHIPMTVELERFNCNESRRNRTEYIAYCGNLGQNHKDGVPILIKAFKEFSKIYPDVFLYIIGDAKNSEKNQVQELKYLVKELNIENKVIFTGNINRDKVTELLCGAKILALAKPNTIQAQGGFPTKLGEYLATGNPVVVTKVGEITDYLIDGKNSFLAEPDSIESFAEKLSQALKHNRAKEIGIEGQKLANEVFNYKVQGKNLKLFLEEIS